MNTKPSSNRTTISVIAAIIIAAIAYFYWSGSTATSNTIVSSDSSSVGSQVLDLLNQIQSLHIDANVFNDPGYKTLRDYSVPIPSVDVGRPNPFAPLPGFSSAGSSASGH
jgi:uncharacterized membrane protein